LKNAPFRPTPALRSDFNPRNIQYIPVVKILTRLDLEQISADFEIEHFSKVSLYESRVTGRNIGFFIQVKREHLL